MRYDDDMIYVLPDEADAISDRRSRQGLSPLSLMLRAERLVTKAEEVTPCHDVLVWGTVLRFHAEPDTPVGAIDLMQIAPRLTSNYINVAFSDPLATISVAK